MKKSITKTFFALGTANSIFLPACDDETPLRRSMQRVLEIDDLFSVFKRDSEISKINAAAGDHFVPVRSDTMYVIRQAVLFSALSGGAFDITARPLIELWGIGKKGDAIPKSRDIAAVRKLVGYSGILIDEQTCSVKLKHRNQAIDLGGIAKGFAADEVRRILLHHGVSDAILNFGGTVVVIGLPRTVGVQHPSKPTGTPMGHLLISDKSIVTSGSNEQYFIRENVRYHHILDPHTGKPAETGLKSVTLIGDLAMEMDALSTAVFVLGMERGNLLLPRFKAQAVYIDENDCVFVSSELKDLFSLSDEHSR